eukprot:12404181-Heterocapsa_arctica.AAC.1
MLSKKWVKARKKDRIRMRFVAREFRSEEDRTDLFTPSTTSSTERVIDLIAAKRGWPTMIIDAKNAFHGEETELVAEEPPDEWLEKWIEDGGDPD